MWAGGSKVKKWTYARQKRPQSYQLSCFGRCPGFLPGRFVALKSGTAAPGFAWRHFHAVEPSSEHCTQRSLTQISLICSDQINELDRGFDGSPGNPF